jgi:senataxin
VWTFDNSPELPHTLFSEIKDNPSYIALLESHYQSAPPPSETDTRKGKGKENRTTDALNWMTDFLVSLVEPGSKTTESAFPEALAKVMHFCFAEMQHEQFDQRLRAAAAETGFKVSYQCNYS